jgi:hypothetical protein
MSASAGTCTAATPDRLILEWLVNEADNGDVFVTDEGIFVMPLRTPAPSDVAC